jgi:hypothetical protein
MGHPWPWRPTNRRWGRGPSGHENHAFYTLDGTLTVPNRTADLVSGWGTPSSSIPGRYGKAQTVFPEERVGDPAKMALRVRVLPPTAGQWSIRVGHRYCCSAHPRSWRGLTEQRRRSLVATPEAERTGAPGVGTGQARPSLAMTPLRVSSCSTWRRSPPAAARPRSRRRARSRRAARSSPSGR